MYGATWWLEEWKRNGASAGLTFLDAARQGSDDTAAAEPRPSPAPRRKPARRSLTDDDDDDDEGSESPAAGPSAGELPESFTGDLDAARKMSEQLAAKRGQVEGKPKMKKAKKKKKAKRGKEEL